MAADTGIPLLPPEEAIDFFRAKGFQVGFAWQDVWQEEHARAFTVAKAMNRDLLETIRQSVDEAIAKGETLAQFRAKLTPLLQAKGWWGRARMRDPATGEMKSVQLGSPRRLKIIYDMNLRMARAAGRWAKIQRTKDAFPYLRYVAVMDERTRPEHAAWHGTILRVDDPWWDTHYPPCGWNCRCTVMQVSEDMLRENGWQVGHNGGPPLDDDPSSYVNPRTGEVSDLPAGIDPGFAYNVGKAWLGGLEPPPLLPPELPALEPGIEPGGPAPGAPSPAGLLPADIAPEAAVEAFLDELAAAPPEPVPVAKIAGDALVPRDAPIEELRAQARNWLREHREAVRAPRLGDVQFGRGGIKKATMILPDERAAEKLLAVPAVPDVIAGGVVRTEPNLKPETKPEVLRVAKISAPIELGGSRRTMEVVLERRRSGWWYHDHSVKAPSGRPVRSGGVSGDVGQGGADGLVDPKSGDRSAADIAAHVVGVEDRVFVDAGGWPLAIGTGWFRGADGAARVPAGDRRRVLGLVGRAIAAPSEIRWRWVTGADGTPMLFRRYIATIDGLAIVVDVGKAGWRFATARDPGFDLARLATGTLAWSAKP